MTILPAKSLQEPKPLTIDMGTMPDVVQTLAVMVATFPNQETIITNISQLKYKESNRIDDTAKELRRLGIKVEVGEDYLKIIGALSSLL